MTLEELLDLVARQPGGTLRLALEPDRRRGCLTLTLEVSGDPGPGCMKGPVTMTLEIDPRLAHGRGASRHLRQIAGEVGHEVRAQVERLYSALADVARLLREQPAPVDAKPPWGVRFPPGDPRHVHEDCCK